MTPAKLGTDNSTHAEVQILNEKIDQLEKHRAEDRNDREKSQSRLQWRIGIVLGVLMSFLMAYMESVRREMVESNQSQKETNASIEQLVEKTSAQAIDIAVIREKTNSRDDLRQILNHMNSEIQDLKLEIERVKKQ
jgi:hypothetical protein